MSTKKKQNLSEKEPVGDERYATKNQGNAANSSEASGNTDNVAEEPADAKITSTSMDWEEKYNQMNDSYLRLMAEFDNYRKRTLREKAELIKSGGESVLTELLPVIDDFERALKNIQSAKDITAVIEGVELIYAKFIAYLLQQGVKVIETNDRLFDTELFEAIATIPAPEEGMKGKILDCILTGYTLHDKVIRHAKVVVGE
jgi:molecular chaperone GrpE